MNSLLVVSVPSVATHLRDVCALAYKEPTSGSARTGRLHMRTFAS
jgi:hypothetical protein